MNHEFVIDSCLFFATWQQVSFKSISKAFRLSKELSVAIFGSIYNFRRISFGNVFRSPLRHLTDVSISKFTSEMVDNRAFACDRVIIKRHRDAIRVYEKGACSVLE